MKEITLENFRCFGNKEIHFKEGLNLLIGDNASGKTSLLKGCKYVLSSFFSGFSDENTRWISPAVDDFREEIIDGVIVPEQPVVISFRCFANLFPGLVYEEGVYNPGDDDKLYELRKNSKKNSRALVSGLTDFRDYARVLQERYFDEDGDHKRQVLPLPLFAGFTTDDIHITRKIDSEKFLSYYQKASFGYYECLESNGFLPYWQKRLLALQEAEINTEEVSIVRKAIQTALGALGCDIIRDMIVRPVRGKIFYKFTDGREVESAYLSEGYLRLVSIVTDLAFRCALLNRGVYGLDACARTQGTVLIDEIDLHLHPTLQSRVIDGLRQAFPQLQFIITTHAPMVMSGVKKSDLTGVYKLSFDSTDKNYGITEIAPYGLDISTITSYYLGQAPRYKVVFDKLNRLFDLVDNSEQTEPVFAFLRELECELGNNFPELKEAAAMLNFRLIDDEED